MATIVFASSKGGAGKSTIALAIATLLCTKAKTTLIDADPNHPIINWLKRGGACPNLNVVKNEDEMLLMDEIAEAEETSQFVIVDLEGSANIRAAYAVASADLVIIPLQPSILDADEASKTLKLIKNESKKLRREIPYRMLWSRIPNFMTRTMKDLEGQLKNAGIPTLDNRVRDLDAYRGIFGLNKSFDQMTADEVPNLIKAKQNTTAVTQEIINIIKELANEQQGQGATVNG